MSDGRRGHRGWVDALIQPDAHGLIRRAGLLALGFTGAEIDRMLRSAALASVRRGSYRLAVDGSERRPEAEHPLRARARR